MIIQDLLLSLNESSELKMYVIFQCEMIGKSIYDFQHRNNRDKVYTILTSFDAMKNNEDDIGMYNPCRPNMLLSTKQ